MSMSKSKLKPLIEMYSQLETESELTDFLEGMHTPQELESLLIRLDIIKRLKKNETQRHIAKKLNIGIATVSRGAREIKNGRFKYV